MLPTALNRFSLAGLSATLVGNGIGRFAFIALMPALIDAGWFTQGEASQLSVATLFGYVVGSWRSDWLARRYSPAVLIRWSMLLISISFFASAFSGAPVIWYYVWRLLAGACGAVLMVLPGPLVIPRHEPSVRVRASSIVFSGVGLGPVLSGLLVPALIAGLGVAVVLGDKVLPLAFRGVEGAWLGLGSLCLALTVASWRQWPEEPAAPAGGEAADVSGRTVWLILVAHGLNAVGYLAHTMFWVDHLVRDLGLTLATGGFYWSVFGVGAAMGPLLAGKLAHRFGTRRCLLGGFALKAVAAALPVWTASAPALFASSLLMGICTPGVLALVASYTLETVGPALNRPVWGKATFSFSLAQGAGGFLMAVAVTQLDSYRPLFLVSAVALLGSIACIAAVGRERPEVVEAEGHEKAAIDPSHPETSSAIVLEK